LLHQQHGGDTAVDATAHGHKHAIRHSLQIRY
jgi:hypothetical protein